MRIISICIFLVVSTFSIIVTCSRINVPFLSSLSIKDIHSSRNLGDLDPDLEKYYLPKEATTSIRYDSNTQQQILKRDDVPKKLTSTNPIDTGNDYRPAWLRKLPRVRFRYDPLINFKLKQQLTLLGASITLGMDYMTDIAQWRSYCQIEDAWLRGRFSLRGSELGWAKSWLLNLGLGEQSSAMIKLRLGLNMKTQRLYAKLRFRTEPMSPFDIGDGLSCAGKLPFPLYLMPSFSRGLPLRVEYRVRINTSRGPQQNFYGRGKNGGGSTGRGSIPYKVVTMTTGLGAVEVSLDELNVCLEWDENSPVWGIGLVRTDPSRKRLPSSVSPPTMSDSSVSQQRRSVGKNSNGINRSGTNSNNGNNRVGSGSAGNRFGGSYGSGNDADRGESLRRPPPNGSGIGSSGSSRSNKNENYASRGADRSPAQSSSSRF